MRKTVATVVFAFLLVAVPSGSAGTSTVEATVSKLVGVRSLAVDPVSATTVYAGTDRGLKVSTDGGRTWRDLWSRIYPTGNRASVFFVTVDARRPQTIYISTEFDGVFRTVDGGRTWSTANKGLGTYTVRQLAIDPHASGTVYAATGDPYGNGVYKTENGGRTWRSSGLHSYFVDAIAIDPRTRTTLYAAYWDPMFANDPEEVIVRSSDGGRTWIDPKPGITTGYVGSLATDRANPSTLYAATSQGVQKSIDRGRHWRLSGPPSVSVVVVNPSQRNTVYAGSKGGLFRSTNGGVSWHRHGGRLADGPINTLAISADGRTLYVATNVGLVPRVAG